jgi:hypothetical protein
MTNKRIDLLPPNTEVVLKFHGSFGNESFTQNAIFLGIEGTGDELLARFRSPDSRGNTWEAYRFNGRWAYGTGADRLSLEGRA